MTAPNETDRQIRELQQVVSQISRELNVVRTILACLVVLVLAAFAYTGWHAVKYRDCTAQPSLLSWPSECV